MLDILTFLPDKGGDPEKIRESQRRRYGNVEIVDEIIALYDVWRRAKFLVDEKGREINANQKEIGLKKRNKENADDLLAKKAELEKEKADLAVKADEHEAEMKKKLLTIGNIVHDSVPVNNNEDFNRVEREWAPEGRTVAKDGKLSHHEVLTRLDGYDPERGVKVVGHRGYFLKKWGLYLNQALINYALEFLSNRTIDGVNYIPLQTPQFMNKDVMAKTAQLEQFDDELYKVVDGDQEKYLIATSEQPISAFHSDEYLMKTDLPIPYAGYSTCYRREAGAHGKDAWGIFRVHQFEKVEQFVITEPEKSWEAFDQMIATAEAFYQSLQIPYRIVSIVSGALNNAASKKYDLEAWFPFQGEYKELVSCSNCTDYQSRRLEIRFGMKKKNETNKTYVHCLNSTLCATERALCCILENGQTDTGFVVPEPLRKYLPGAPEFIEYTKELPKDTTSTRMKKKDVVVQQ